jgi:hypothetical protein
LTQLFPPDSFAVIVCHNLLEFVDKPTEVLQALRSLLMRRDTAMASVMVRNRAGEVLSAAIKNGDLGAAERNLTASKVPAKLMDEPVSLFTPQQLRHLLATAKLDPLSEFGIRVLSDYLPEQFLNEQTNYSGLLGLERTLGARAEFAAIARYTQMIARPLEEGNSAARTNR